MANGALLRNTTSMTAEIPIKFCSTMKTGSTNCELRTVGGGQSLLYTISNQIKSNQIYLLKYHINIGSSKSDHEQGQQGWKQH